MRIKTKEAGDFINAKCTRCKIFTMHTIVAMVAGRVARVKCNSCGGEHNYHAPKEAKVPLTTHSIRTRAGKPSVSGCKKVSALDCQEQWRAALARLDATTAVAYKMDGRYIKDTLITHSTFGVGVVTALSYGKMEVFFHNGPTWLCCR